MFDDIVNDIVKTIKKNWQVIVIIMVVCWIMKENGIENFEEGIIIKAGCEGEPLSGYIDDLGENDQKNRTNMSSLAGATINSNEV